MNILIVGSGGREHALAWKIAQSSHCDKLFIAPGNAGTAQVGTNVDIDPTDFPAVKSAIIANQISLIVVGPEQPLVLGLVDFIHSDEQISHCKVIGPEKSGARLEGSKDFSKAFMQKYGIPTAGAQTFTVSTINEGKEFLRSIQPPFVLKADGLAAGKGVIITDQLEEAEAALEDMLVQGRFGDASAKVLIEEYLDGIELSVFVLTNGKEYKILPEAKDYKRIGENDQGPNTGGMGAISPVPFAHPDFLKKVETEVILPTLHGLATEKIPFTGFLFIGLMNVAGQPKVIEYNVRLGDPETEVIIPRVKSDLVELFLATVEGKLDQHNLEIEEATATTVMLVAGGYPGAYAKGDKIEGATEVQEAILFHAGTKMHNGLLVTNGGRVMACTGLGKNKEEALAKSYTAANKVRWKEIYFRKDIGFDL